MKADRLISILMILQVKRQITASELASKLEVSVRTIYRDIDDLSSIGIPISCDRGQGGGIKLLGDYQTTLTGLNTEELNFLFMPNPTNLLEGLNINKIKTTTFEKLLASLSTSQRNVIKDMENYIYIDMHGWHPSQRIEHHLLTPLQKAVWDSRRITICYKKYQSKKVVTLCPLSLVLKRTVWYLIGLDENLIKTYKVSSIEEILEIGDSFIRPDSFNLEKYWLSQMVEFPFKLPTYNMKIKTTERIYQHIKSRNIIRIIDTQNINEDFIITLQFDAEFQAIELIMGYGDQAEIVEPRELIDKVTLLAQGIITQYNTDHEDSKKSSSKPKLE